MTVAYFFISPLCISFLVAALTFTGHKENYDVTLFYFDVLDFSLMHKLGVLPKTL